MRAALRADLTAAMKAKDRIAVSALRSALAAIDDAETVPAAPQPGVEASEHVAGAAAGIGAADVARKQLTEEEMRAVVAREHRERVAAAMTYAELGRNQDASRARAEADVLARYL
ncbi:GatB/YqeY domain-containing protein [Thermocrispum sp.]|uniref:GatB/YqeY domain-containing protein n=1 Tax=Thermocrispum agreste TaxID=37925 RepID=A0A2W4JKZ5_9PSEU|nr:GatB/YqeY domain-containing protein [Thermocrispum sp.]PZM99794.1 MAG: hypothetical protein DIU77_05030 [Thermocrispum agreste]